MSFKEVKKINSDMKKSLDVLIKELFIDKITPIFNKIKEIESKISLINNTTNRGNIKTIKHYSGYVGAPGTSGAYEDFYVGDVNKSIIIVNGQAPGKCRITACQNRFELRSSTDTGFYYFVTTIEFY